MVAAMLGGRTPDPADGRRGKQRSMHNNYLTLPVLFVMVSNHYPLTYGATWPWAVLGTVTAAGMLIRHFVNLRQRGRVVATPLVLAGLFLIGLVIALAPDVSFRMQAGLGGTTTSTATAVPFTTAQAIVTARCTPCHALHPTEPGFTAPPAGVRLDDAASIRARAGDIRTQVASGAMPLGNATGMTPAERRALVAWAGG